MLSGCVTSIPSDVPSPKVDYLKMTERKFLSPSDATIFQLSLGQELSQDTGGITKVPEGILGIRQATASYYSIKNANGTGYGEAESSITEDLENCIRYIEIQHEPNSGKILITEDTSDALPCKRYILLTPTRPGYRVDYLAPNYESNFKQQGYPSPPPAVILLPKDRAWIEGQIIPISRIPKSRHPFSIGA